MRYSVIIILLTLFSIQLWSQEKGYSYGKFEPGTKTLVFGDKVNIREVPSTSSKVVAQLTIGKEVTILERSEEMLTLNNYKESWYKIQFNSSQTGYIWGGLLAKGYLIREISSKYPGKEKIIFGLNKMVEYSKIAEVRFCNSQGQILSSLEFNAIAISFGKEDNTFAYSTTVKYVGNKGFKPAVELFAVSFSYEACDYPNGEAYLYILGGKLHHAFESSWTSNELGSVYPELVFPNGKDGEYNVVVETNTYTERDEDYNTKDTWQSIIKYVWSGKKFYKTPETKLK